MNFLEYSPLALRTAKPMPHIKQVQHAQLGLLTELGELADDVKKAFIYGKAFDAVNAAIEIGDYAWYLNLLCDEEKIHPRHLDEQIANMKDSDFDESRDEVELSLELGKMTTTLLLDEETRGTPLLPLVQVIVGLLAVLAKRFGTTLDNCLATNIAKLAKRYGDKYSDYAALNRDVAAERTVEEGVMPQDGKA